MAKVFVSHRSKDKPLAARLAADIEAAGHTVWIDIREINVGDSIVGKIDSGLSAADYVVLCYSVHGVESPWIVREWASTLARQLEGHGVRILPAILSGGDAPAILADLKTADLTADWDDGVVQILRAMA
jgi:hypothetical protein